MKQKTTKPGDKMRDHTLYAGVSPDTGARMYTMPEDVSFTMDFDQASDHAAEFDAADWRVPSKGELAVLFNNRAALGGFAAGARYWTSSENDDGTAWTQSFSDGAQSSCAKDKPLSVRLVR